MKKTFGLFIILFTLILASCGGVSTASTLMVIEKGQSNNNKEYWIEAYDPYNQKKDEAFKIMIQEKMVWNLIEEDKEYFAMYSKKGDNLRVLENIKH
jgi:cupin superfamily acireductone dioxygenase involved in methionine salvage